jgi:hypothetical protein
VRIEDVAEDDEAREDRVPQGATPQLRRAFQLVHHPCGTRGQSGRAQSGRGSIDEVQTEVRQLCEDAEQLRLVQHGLREDQARAHVLDVHPDEGRALVGRQRALHPEGVSAVLHGVLQPARLRGVLRRHPHPVVVPRRHLKRVVLDRFVAWLLSSSRNAPASSGIGQR